jgi:hypothetical protein
MNRSYLKRNSTKISNTEKIKDENLEFLYLAKMVILIRHMKQHLIIVIPKE